MLINARHASDFSKLQTQFDQKMDRTSGAVKLQTLASPSRDDNRGRRREQEDGDDHNGEGGDGSNATRSLRKHRKREDLNKKFRCLHKGCKKSYL